jgi:hypothetical protein
VAVQANGSGDACGQVEQVLIQAAAGDRVRSGGRGGVALGGGVVQARSEAVSRSALMPAGSLVVAAARAGPGPGRAGSARRRPG